MIEREGCRNVVAAALTMVMMVGHSPALAQEALPRVLVLTTGGTIAGGMPGQELVEAVPQIATIADLTVEEFSRVGSSSITPAHWVGLARRINEAFREDPGLQGVVVTHGTDSMEETSYFLHLTVNDERPVVVTGAMRGPRAVSADGPANLISAVRVVAASEARCRGVLVVLNDEIHSARDVRKMDSNRVDAFQSPDWGAIGVVDSDTILIHRTPLRIHTRSSRLELPTDSLPTVPIVADYPGSDGSTVRHWADRGV
ncbi:MAG: asparaginase, partial [Dehalococcoidia bacterium]